MTIDRSLGIVRADENGLPIHGALAAAEDWDVVDAGSDASAAWLSAALDYGRRDDRLAVFPFPHRLELDVRLQGDALTITTTVEPTGENEVPLAFGWHPWLALPGVPRAEWELALPARTPARARRPQPPDRRARAGRRRARRRSATACSTTTSPSPRTRASLLAGGGREIAVEWAGGYRYAQVFAPAALDVACLEPMMAPSPRSRTARTSSSRSRASASSATFRVRVT